MEGLTHSLGHQGSSPPPQGGTQELFLKSKQGLRAALAEHRAGRESQERREQTATAEPTPRPCDVSPTHCDITRWQRGEASCVPLGIFIVVKYTYHKIYPWECVSSSHPGQNDIRDWTPTGTGGWEHRPKIFFVQMVCEILLKSGKILKLEGGSLLCGTVGGHGLENS